MTYNNKYLKERIKPCVLAWDTHTVERTTALHQIQAVTKKSNSVAFSFEALCTYLLVKRYRYFSFFYYHQWERNSAVPLMVNEYI